jgi:hypothetical protein
MSAIPGQSWFTFLADPTGNRVGLYKGMSGLRLSCQELQSAH